MKKLLLLLFFVPFVLSAQDFWTEASPFVSQPGTAPTQISIVDDTVVWVLGIPDAPGTDPRWSRSLDGGQTWTSGNIDLGDTNRHISSLHAVSISTAYVSVFCGVTGTFGGVWVTTDSGATWTQQTSALFNTADSYANLIYFFDANNGVVVGDPNDGYFEVYTTSDAGITWTLVQTPALIPTDDEEYGLTNLFATSGNSIFIPTTFGRILKTTDRGLTWTVNQSPVSELGSSLNSILAFNNPDNGLLLKNGIYSTNDGGVSWNNLNPSSLYGFDGIAAVPQTGNTYFNWGETALLEKGNFYSLDGGNTWLEIYPPVNIESARFHSGTVGYCLGQYTDNPFEEMKFFRLTDQLNRLSNQHFVTDNIFTALPNPTTGIVKISGKNIHAVSVYDISGKTVATKDYHDLQDARLDVSALRSGIYFAEISSSSGNSSTIKLIKN